MSENSPISYRLAVTGSSLLAATVAVMLTTVGYVLDVPRLDPTISARLTALGREWYLPDHDLIIYLSGCVAAVAFVLGLHLAMKSRLKAIGPGKSETFLGAWACRGVILSVLVFGSGILGLKFSRVSSPGSVLRVLSLAMIAVPAILALLVGMGKIGRDTPFARLSDRWRPAPSPDAGEVVSSGPGSISGRLLACLTAVLIVAVLYSPQTEELAGRAYLTDLQPFHHIDFFAVGPALNYRGGRAFGTEIYAQYGVGWPMLLAWTDRLVPITYGATARMASIIGCFFFLGLLLFFRSFAGDWAWAAAGTLMALLVQNFTGQDWLSSWFSPSSSILRSPMLVCVFWAISRHATTNQLPWAILAGGSVGLALLFEIDTGIYLLATLAFYFGWVLVRRIASPAARWSAVAGGSVAMVATLLCGLAIASRGTILQLDFWSGWLEGPRLYVSGMSALPINGIVQMRGIILFLAITVAYLGSVGLLVANFADRAEAPKTTTLACLGFYGLMSMLHFVNRSHPWNIYHVCIPAIGLATYAASVGLRSVFSPRANSGLPFLVWTICLIALAFNPNFRKYPSLARAVLKGAEPAGLRLMPGVGGLPDSSKKSVDDFAAVTREVADLYHRGNSVCILDPSDTMYYLGSGVPPQDRYSPLLACMIWQHQVNHRKAQLRDDGPDWIAMKPLETWRPLDGRDARPFYASMDELAQSVAQFYSPVRHVGSFVLWRRNAKISGPAATPVPRTSTGVES